MPSRQAVGNAVLLGFGVIYPALVFCLRGSVDPRLFIILALAIVGLRLTLGKAGLGGWRPALLGAALILAGLATIDAALAARAYPVLISLAAAAVFAASLWRPPSLVEGLALATGEPWSPALRDYCRTVTAIWALWLSVNGAIAAMLALTGDTAAWALWTGLLSYLVSGMLFAGEWMVRRRLPGRQAR